MGLQILATLLPSSPSSDPTLVTSPTDVTASSSDLPSARRMFCSDIPPSATPCTYPPAASLDGQPIPSSSYDIPAAVAGNNYLNLMMPRLRGWLMLGRRGLCLLSGIFQARTPLTQVVFFFWVSLLLMIALLVLVNTNQTRPSLLNHIPRFLVFFSSILLFFLSTFALVLRAFVWPPRGPLKKLGFSQNLFWYVIGVMGWAFVANVVHEEDTNSLVSLVLLAVLSISSSNVFLHTTTNLGLMDSLVGLCASAGYKIATHKLVGFFVITLFVAGFGFAKFYSEAYKSWYTRKDVDDIEKGYSENDDAYVLIIALGYATRNIIESLETGLRRIEESINTSIHEAIAELLGANVDRGVIVGFGQIEKMVRSAIQDASRNVIGDLEATLLPQILMGLNIESIMSPVNEEMVTAIMDSTTRNIIVDIQMGLVDGIQTGLTQIYTHKTTTGSGYTIPLTEDEVKEIFSNGTKNDHEASGSGTY